MKKTLQLTSKQCRRARGLLHWNLQDITSRCSITRVRLEQFERGDVPLIRTENEILYKLFQKHGIIINTRGEVLLREDAKEISDEVAKDDNIFAVDTDNYDAQKVSHHTDTKDDEDEEERKKRFAAQHPKP